MVYPFNSFPLNVLDLEMLDILEARRTNTLYCETSHNDLSNHKQ